MQWNPAVWVEDSRQFLMEVRTEFRKVTWPSRKETTMGTIGVLIMVAIVTTVLAVIDFGLGAIMQWLLPS